MSAVTSKNPSGTCLRRWGREHRVSKQLRGQVKAKGYESWIELQSAQLGQSRQVPARSGRGTNRQASAPTVHKIVASKLMDSVSSALFKASIEGEGKLVLIAFEGRRKQLYEARAPERADRVLTLISRARTCVAESQLMALSGGF